MNYQGRLTRFELSCYDANNQTLDLNYPRDRITPGELKYRAIASKNEVELKRVNKIIADLVQENKYCNRTINNMSHKIDKLEDWRQQDQIELDQLKYDLDNQSHLVDEMRKSVRFFYNEVENTEQKNNLLKDELELLTKDPDEWKERFINALAISMVKDIEVASVRYEREQLKSLTLEVIEAQEVLINDKELQENKYKELENEKQLLENKVKEMEIESQLQANKYKALENEKELLENRVKELETVDQLQENKIGVLEITVKELRNERQILENENKNWAKNWQILYDAWKSCLGELTKVSNRLNKISILRKDEKQPKREVKELMKKYRQLRSDNRTVGIYYRQRERWSEICINYLKFHINRLKRRIAMTKIKRRFHAKPLKRRHRKSK